MVSLTRNACGELMRDDPAMSHTERCSKCGHAQHVEPCTKYQGQENICGCLND